MGTGDAPIDDSAAVGRGACATTRPNATSHQFASRSSSARSSRSMCATARAMMRNATTSSDELDHGHRTRARAEVLLELLAVVGLPTRAGWVT